MRGLICLCWCCCLLGAAERNYLAAAQDALRAGDRAQAQRLLHFARAAQDLGLAERLTVDGYLAALALHVETDEERAGRLPVERWRLERILRGEPMNRDDWQVLSDARRRYPDDPLIHRIDATLLPAWVVASGYDDYGPWLGLAAGLRLVRFRVVPVGAVTTDDGRVLRLERNILIAETPCSLGQWHGLFPDLPLPEGGLDRPLSGLGAADLVAAVAALDERLPAAHLRLPTANEWEYAMRAGLSGAYLAEPLTREDAVFDGLEPQPLGRHAANAWGLFDVHGSIWELCREGDGRLSRRGGSWRSRAADCAFDRVVPVVHEGPDPTLGLRLVIEP